MALGGRCTAVVKGTSPQNDLSSVAEPVHHWWGAFHFAWLTRLRPIGSVLPLAEMQKVADAADISVLFFSAGNNFWAIWGHFWAILGHFSAIFWC